MDLYLASFPKDEREPEDWFAKRLDGDPHHEPLMGRRFRLLVAESDTREVLAMRSFETCADIRMGFLVYLAVRPENRGHGIGKRLIDVAIAYCRLDMLASGVELDAVVFEAERIELATSPQEMEARQRRLAYFEGLGAFLLTDSYVQPALTPDRAPVPLNLLAHYVREGADRSTIVRDFCTVFMGAESVHALIGLRDS